MADGYENQAPEKFQGEFKVKVICCILGIGCLASWNSMLTIADYYYQVFPDYHPSRVLTGVYQPFALGTIVILAYHESKINTRKRNLIGYTIFTISTFLLIVKQLDLTTRGRGGIGPYIGLCAIVASFGLAEATVHGGMIGDLSLMCPELIQPFLAGMGAAGALTSAFRLMTKAAFENLNDGLRKGAMIFLAISALIQFLCVMLYAYVFPKLPIVKYYRRKAASEGSKTVTADLAAAGIQNQSYSTDDVSNNQRLSNKQLLVQNMDYAVNLALIYLLSLSIFPGFLYENTGQHGLGSWYALVLVAMYNCGNMVGRYTPLVEWLKIENRKWLTVAVLSRFLLIPAFYFTAKYGDQGWMIMLVSVLGLTTGHFNVCILITAPKGYMGPEKNALGNLLVVFLTGGIVAGTSLGWLWLIAENLQTLNANESASELQKDRFLKPWGPRKRSRYQIEALAETNPSVQTACQSDHRRTLAHRYSARQFALETKSDSNKDFLAELKSCARYVYHTLVDSCYLVSLWRSCYLMLLVLFHEPRELKSNINKEFKPRGVAARAIKLSFPFRSKRAHSFNRGTKTRTAIARPSPHQPLAAKR